MPTSDFILERAFPGVHFDELDTCKDLIHGAHTSVRDRDGFPPVEVDQSTHSKLKKREGEKFNSPIT